MDIPEWFSKSFDMLSMRSDPDASPPYFPYTADNSLYSVSNSTDSISPGSNLNNSGPLHTPIAPRKIVGRVLKYDDSLFTTRQDSQDLQAINSNYAPYELFPKRSDDPKPNNTGLDCASMKTQMPSVTNNPYDTKSTKLQPNYAGIEVSTMQASFLNPVSSDSNAGYNTLYFVTSVKLPLDTPQFGGHTSTQFQSQSKPLYWRQADERFVSQQDLQYEKESDFTPVGAYQNTLFNKLDDPPRTPLGSNNFQFGENYESNSWSSSNSLFMNQKELQLGRETSSHYVGSYKDQVPNQAEIQFGGDDDQFRRKLVNEYLNNPYELLGNGSYPLFGRKEDTGSKKQTKPQSADRLHRELFQKYDNPESEMQYNVQPNGENKNYIKLPLVDTSSSSEDFDLASPKICMFCRKNGELTQVYTTHLVKEKVGKTYVTTCPILRAHVCPVCKQSGDKGHTISYCPLLKTINGPMQSTTICLKNTKVKSNGRKRF